MLVPPADASTGDFQYNKKPRPTACYAHCRDEVIRALPPYLPCRKIDKTAQTVPGGRYKTRPQILRPYLPVTGLIGSAYCQFSAAAQE